MKRSIFSKIFINNIIMISIVALVLAVTGYFLISSYVYEERVDAMEENATAIQGFIHSGGPPEKLQYNLYALTHSSNKNILITDLQGKILMASVNEDTYNKESLYVNQDFLDTKKRDAETAENQGTLKGIYSEPMFTLRQPVMDRRGQHMIGFIFISTPTPEIFSIRADLFTALGLAILIAVLLDLILSYILSRRISKPIKAIGSAAKRFAGGDFSSRVQPLKRGGNFKEIAELTTTFNDMAFHLEKADDIRNNFISDVSHELRTPMTTIGGFVDGIMDGTIPPENQNEYLGIVKEEISRLSSLVNSFLDVTRSETGNQALEITVFDINETIRRTLLNLESGISEKNIDVNIYFDSDPCYVKADLNAIKRVLTNLMENAIKFTDSGGEIRISVSQRQNEVAVSIFNTGCGIAEDDLQFIFERFYKADKSRSLNRNGTGIGLYIVKDIINRHGKNIGVRSVEGQYAEFVFSLDRGKQ